MATEKVHGLFCNPITTWHSPVHGTHPEAPERVTHIQKGLIDSGLVERMKMFPGTVPTREQLETCHTAEYLDRFYETANSLSARRKFIRSHDDLYMNRYTVESALGSAGLALQAAELIGTDVITDAAVISRPPGHHASAGYAGGFCFLNNAALAAKAIAAHGKWVVIFDWDVHFGDGTVSILQQDDKDGVGMGMIGVATFQQYDYGEFYPGTGKSFEKGNVLSVGYEGGINGEMYQELFRSKLLPWLKRFGPDVIIISAGFDAAEGDPLGGCNLQPDDYKYMVTQLKGLTERVMVVLEGGYNLDVISRCFVASVAGLME